MANTRRVYKGMTLIPTKVVDLQQQVLGNQTEGEVVTFKKRKISALSLSAPVKTSTSDVVSNESKTSEGDVRESVPQSAPASGDLAATASSSVDISTKPNPLLRPDL